jgi:hypothetical protein
MSKDQCTAYLLNAAAGTLQVVRLEPHARLDSILQHLGCAAIDAVSIDDQHVAYCDDSGLMNGGLACFSQIKGVAVPLAGNLLIVGTDAYGEDVEPSLSLEQVQQLVTITRAVLVPVLETIDRPGFFGTHVKGFQMQAIRQKPALPNA